MPGKPKKLNQKGATRENGSEPKPDQPKQPVEPTIHPIPNTPIEDGQAKTGADSIGGNTNVLVFIIPILLLLIGFYIYKMRSNQKKVMPNIERGMSYETSRPQENWTTSIAKSLGFGFNNESAIENAEEIKKPMEEFSQRTELESGKIQHISFDKRNHVKSVRSSAMKSDRFNLQNAIDSYTINEDDATFDDISTQGNKVDPEDQEEREYQLQARAYQIAQKRIHEQELEKEQRF